MTDNFDFSQHKINLGDTDYPQKHNAAMDALERLGNDTVQRAQEAAHHAAIAAKRVMTKPEFDTIRQNEIRNLLGAGFKKTDFDNDYEFAQVNGWQNKFKLNANEIVIDGVWHSFNDTMIELHDAPNGLQNIDLTQPDYADIDAAIAAGGTSLSKSYLRQREIVIAIQEDIAVTAANATSMTYIQDANNHVYSVDGQLRQRVLSFVVERLPISVPMASKHFAYGDARNAMNALGWTETDITGQWEKGGKLGVALTWIERRNQGAGHPMNPDGCAEVNRGDGFFDKWYRLVDRISSFNHCFTAGYFRPDSGSISDTVGKSGRWNSDEKFHDGIYATDVQDLRLNSGNIPNAQLLNLEMNKSISGNVAGFESIPFTMIVSSPTSKNTEIQYRLINNSLFNLYVDPGIATSLGGSNIHEVGKRYQINVSSDGINYATVEGEYVEYTSGGGYQFQNSIIISGSINTDGNWQYIGMHDAVLQAEGGSAPSYSSEPIVTCIIGRPTNILETAKKLGVKGFYGIWIATVPDGVVKTYVMARKILTGIGFVATTNNGISWSTGSISSWVGPQNGVASAVVATDIYFVNYRTKAHFTDSSKNLRVKLRGDVFASNWNSIEYGSLFVSSLIGKISSNTNQSTVNKTISLKSLGVLHPFSGAFDQAQYAFPEHESIELVGNAPACKSLFSVTEIDGFKAIQLRFKELKKNNGIWGDDNKIQTVDGVSMLADENGNDVIYGTHMYVTNVLEEK